jgi:O-antigen/teichoic acid export membrane protein
MLLSSGLVGYVGSLLLSILLARRLGQAGFGAWVVAFALAQTLATLGLVGADWILMRQGSHYQGTGDIERLRKTIHLALLFVGASLGTLGIVLVLLAPTLGTKVFHDPSVIPMLRVAALLGPLNGAGQIMLYATQAFRTVRDLAVVRNLVQPVVRLGAAAVAMAIVPTPLSAMWGSVGAELVLAATATYRLNRRIPLFGPTKPVAAGPLMRFALPVWGSRVLETVRAQLFPVLLGSLTAFAASAAFVASRRLVVAPTAIIAAMNQVYSPQASFLFLEHRMSELAVLIKSLAKWSFTLAFPLFCAAVAFPKEILSVFGSSFRSASTALVILSIGMLFQFATGPVTTTLIVMGKSKWAFWDYVAVVTIEVSLGVALIPRYGLAGAATARAVGTGVNNLIPMAQVWLHLHIHPYRRDFWKPIAAGLIATAVALVVVRASGIGTGIQAGGVGVGVLGMVYLAVFVAFGLSPEDRTALATLRASTRRRGRPSTASTTHTPMEEAAEVLEADESADGSLSPLVDEPGG